MKHPQTKRPNANKQTKPTPKEAKLLLGMFVRYFALLLIGTGNLYIIYAILSPLTISVAMAVLSIFTNPVRIGNFIGLTGITIEIIPACVAGAAFYLLLILTLSVPNVKPVIRTKAIITAIAILFILNITRILVLIPLVKSIHFQAIHWVIWHIVSTLFVVATWFAITAIYKIKSIPIYTDIKYLIKSIKKTKRKK